MVLLEQNARVWWIHLHVRGCLWIHRHLRVLQIGVYEDNCVLFISGFDINLENSQILKKK